MVGRAVSRLVRRERSWESTSVASAAAAPRMIHSATAFVVVLQLLASCLLASVTAATTSLEKKSYVAYLGAPDPVTHPDSLRAKHQTILVSALGSVVAAESALLYSYKHVFNGFSAHLSLEEFSVLSEMPEVVAIFESRVSTPHTTHSWEYLGLETGDGSIPENSLWKASKYGADVIIGSLDTGVWPESQSYSDEGLGPIPAKWKGKCQKGEEFGPENCNKKLIGGKFFVAGYAASVGGIGNVTALGDVLSARDTDGHGTHTSSTAGGSFVPGANEFGQANGTAKGGAPHARIAAYKVCWVGGCFDTDILAAMDEGIADGVDIFTLSLGSSPPLIPLYEDSIAIGAFSASQKGIVTVCSAGNDGPTPASVTNVAPWIITVAASTIDRNFSSYAILGNNESYQGFSVTNEKLDQILYPLVYAGDVGLPGVAGNNSYLCFNGTLDPTKVKGKIVGCTRGITARVLKGAVVGEAGGIGMILGNPPADGNDLEADPHFIPATMVDADDATAIFDYIATTISPLAQITPATTVLGIKPAPVIASFSSQGPNSLFPDILKPDVTAPGVNILAAWSGAASPTGLPFDKRIVQYNIISGTSMACPHTTGVATLLRAAHHDWSPSAIQSAIITTATHLDNTGEVIRNGSAITGTAFDYGAGQINPNAAADPGLVYEATAYDYSLFLCSLGYNTSDISIITGSQFVCPAQTPTTTDLNYPSIAISALNGKRIVTRTVTNVGPASSVYKSVIQAPSGIKVLITPNVLKFTKTGEKLTFNITFTASQVTGEYVFGSYTWTDGSHDVRSPIAVQVVSK